MIKSNVVKRISFIMRTKVVCSQGFRASAQRMIVSVRHAGQELAPLAEYVQTFITPASVCITHNLLPLQQLFRTEYMKVYDHSLIDIVY